MKKVFTVLGLFTILFTLASCQKEQTTVLRATISHYQSDSKVYIENKIAYWHESDQIWINGTTSTGLSTLTDSQFEIVMPDGFEPTPGATLNAVYPSDVVNGSLSSTITTVNNVACTTYSVGIRIPDNQVYEVDRYGKQIVKAPMVAQATVNSQGGADVTFHNVCSLLKVMVHPNVFVHTITISQADNATNHPSLAGNATITFDESTPSLAMATGGSQTITLTVNASRADGIFYIVIPPYSQETKLIATIYDNPQTIIIRGQANNHTLPGNRIAEINCVDNLRGLFSVSADDMVSFARGNLTTVGGSYTFTTNQYDLGTTYTQANIETYSTTMGPEWFILDEGQWDYLLNTRRGHNANNVENVSASALKVRAQIGTTKGLILLPDDWFYLYRGNINVTDGHNMNGLTVSQWQELETYGAVFLPAITSESQNHNYYWTSTQGQAVAFGSGNGQGGTGDVTSLSSGTSAHIRHAHYVVRGDASTDSNEE
ncbi:MAG: hypothetical protein IKH33_10745 [Bacteroidales bacterium]|nr:hypothetical protein [Bacteroidales bacterium]